MIKNNGMEDFYEYFQQRRKEKGLKYNELALLINKTPGALRTAFSERRITPDDKIKLQKVLDSDMPIKPSAAKIDAAFIEAVVDNYERLKENPAFQNLIKIERLEAREEVLRELMAKTNVAKQR